MNKKSLLVLFFIIGTIAIVVLSYLGYQKFYIKNKNIENNIQNSENIENVTKAEEVNVNVKSEENSDKEENQEEKTEEKNVEKKDEKIEEVEKTPVFYTAGIPIFMYHWIKDDTGDYPWPENMIRPATLEEQVKYLVDNDFECIFITDLEKIYNYKKPVALTFDDGWHDVYLHMFPIAKKYNVKFSMYIIKDMVGDPGYCTEAQLKEMQKSGLVDIQSHTVTHQYLAQLSYDRQKAELFDSKTYLKEAYDVDSTVICYPYGSRNNYTVELSKEAGYKYGLDMDGGVYYTNTHTDPLKIPRIYANRSMTINTFMNYANEAYVNAKWE